MRYDFGRDSFAETGRFNWNMWYPWPPFHQRYRNEPGLHIHLSATDARGARSAIERAAGSAGTALGPSLGAFASVVPRLASRLLRNPSGGMDIRFSEHGFQVNDSAAADPSAFLGPAWRPVALALAQLGTLGANPSAPMLADADLTATEGTLIAVEALDI